MKVIVKEISVPSRNSEIAIDLYADTHLGSLSVDEKLLRRHVSRTASNGNYWCHLGDIIDGIVPPDRRFDMRNLTPWAQESYLNNELIQGEWDMFKDIFDSISSQCLFVLDGDGKHNCYNNISDCMKRALANMNILGGHPSVYLILKFNRHGSIKEVPLVFHHGWFAGRRAGSKVNNLELALLTYPEAWGFFCGHGHTKAAIPPQVSLVVRGDHIEDLIRRAAMTGSYLKTYAEDTVGYADRKGYPPVALGHVTVIIRPYATDVNERIELRNL